MSLGSVVLGAEGWGEGNSTSIFCGSWRVISSSAVALNTAIESRDTVRHFHCCYEVRYKMRFICNNLIEKIESWGMDVPESLSSQPGVTRGCESHSKVWVGREKKNRALTFSAATIKDKGIDQFVHYELWPQLQSSLPTVRYLGPLNWCHNSAFCFFFFLMLFFYRWNAK